MSTYDDALAAIKASSGDQTPGAVQPADGAVSPYESAINAIKNPDSPAALGLAPGQVTGTGANVAAGLAQGVSSLINTASDLPHYLVDVPVNTLTAAAHDVLAPLLGYPRYTTAERNAAINRNYGPSSLVSGEPKTAAELGSDRGTPPGTAAIGAAARAVGLPTPEDVVPTTPSQETLRAGISGATSMLPFGGVPAIAGFVGGVAGKRLGEMVPEYLQPLAEMVGNYAGQMGFYGAGTVGHAIGRIGRDTFDTARGPVGAGVAEPIINPDTGQPMPLAIAGPPGGAGPIAATPRDLAAVGTTLAQRAGMTPQALADTLETAPAAPAGVNPTVPAIVSEATGNPALLAYQKQIMNASPEVQAAFDARHAQNVLGIVNGLKAAAPSDVGEATGTYLRNQLRALTALTDLSNRNATLAASTTAESAGLTPPAVPTTVQDIGTAQRTQLKAMQEKDYKAEQDAFDAMPSNLAVNMAPVGEAARNVMATEPGPGGSFHPAEAKIYNDVSAYNGVVPFSEVRQLLRNTTAAKRQITTELGDENPAYGRLSQFQNAITDTLGDAASRGAETDVAAGIPTDQRLSTKIAAMPPVRAPQAPIRMANGVVFDPDRTGWQPATAATPAGGQVAENFTPDARQMWKDRNQAYAIYKDKWRYGTMGAVLRPAARYLGFRVPDSKVSDWLFPSGAKGAEAADDLAKAVGSRENALAVLGDYPALTLRNSAMRDGTMDLNKFEAWKRAYGPSLAKYPEIAAKFDTAADAQRTVEAAAARGKQVVESFEDSAASHYLTKTGEPADPQVAIGRLMSAKNPAADARDLMSRVGQDGAATAGVQRNVIDWMLAKMTARSELGLTGQMDASAAAINGILKEPRYVRALETVLTPSQMTRVRDTATQLNQLARAWNAVRLRGSPGTAMDIIRSGILQHGFQGFTHMAAAIMAMSMFEHFGPEGLVAGPLVEAAGLSLNALRSAGIQTRNDLMAQAMLNPRFGRIAAEKAIENPRSPLNKLTTRRMIEALIGSAENTQSEATRRLQHRGTRTIQ